MNRTRFKIAAWLLLAVFLMAVSLLAVAQIGRLLAAFQEGADPASALNIEPNKPLDWPIDLTWRADSNPSGRDLEPLVREQIEAAYIRAWLQWHFSYTRGDPFGLGTYFTGPALEAIEASVTTAAAQGLTLDQVDTRHELELTFYSADGSVAALTDHHAQVMRIATDAEGEVIFSAETNATYDIVMLLDDGRWRIRHWLRTSDVSSPQTVAPPLPQPLVGINYYPQDTPWDLFWTAYDRDIIADDFERMADLGLNSVRIFIPFEQFGGPEVDPALMRNVLALLDQAERDNIGVVVTLFDFYTDYALLRWNHADRHLETIVKSLRQHPALLAWDVKNEPDRDYNAHGRHNVDAWLAHAIGQIRRYDDQTPITIGWSLPEVAATLANEVDFVSFHYYAPAEQFVDSYATLRAEVGENRPIMLTEFGLPTWNSYLFPNGHSTAEQAVYYADMRRAFDQTDLGGYMAWTLYDFPTVPSNVAGAFPWQTGPQRHLGLVNMDGTDKPAAALLTLDADLDAIDPLPPFARFTKPFWRTVFVVLLLTTFTMRQAWHRYRG